MLPIWVQNGVSEDGSRSGYQSKRTAQMMITMNSNTRLVLHSSQTLSVFILSLNSNNSLTREAFFSDEVLGPGEVKWPHSEAAEGAGLGLWGSFWVCSSLEPCTSCMAFPRGTSFHWPSPWPFQLTPQLFWRLFAATQVPGVSDTANRTTALSGLKS